MARPVRLLTAVAALALAVPAPATGQPVRVGATVVTPVGDLDADGVADLAEANATRLAARSGATGAVLWELPGAYTDVRAFSLGAGEPGVLAVTTSPADLALTAVDRAGRPRWHRRWPLAHVYGATGHLTGNVATGADDEAVVLLRVGGYPTGRTAAEVVDGATGTPVSVLRPDREWWRGPTLVGDLDRDGTTDLAWIEHRSGHERDTGVARAWSADKGPLWENAVLEYVATDTVLTPVGDVTGDGRPDVTVRVAQQPRPRTALLSGADGRLVWTRSGGVAVAAGNVGGSRHADVLVNDSDVSRPAEGLTLRAYDGRGRLLYQRWHKFHLVEAAGDVDGDGTGDVRVEWSREFEELRAGYRGPHEGFVSGRTGRLLRTNPYPGERPLLASVDCRGADTWRTIVERSALVRARDGRTGRLLWSLTVPFNRDHGMPGVVALPRVGSRCAGVLVVGSGYLAVVEPSGRVRWSVTTR